MKDHEENEFGLHDCRPFVQAIALRIEARLRLNDKVPGRGADGWRVCSIGALLLNAERAAKTASDRIGFWAKFPSGPLATFCQTAIDAIDQCADVAARYMMVADMLGPIDPDWRARKWTPRCEECGSDEIQEAIWIECKTGQNAGGDGPLDRGIWCPACEEHSRSAAYSSFPREYLSVLNRAGLHDLASEFAADHPEEFGDGGCPECHAVGYHKLDCHRKTV